MATNDSHGDDPRQHDDESTQPNFELVDVGPSDDHGVDHDEVLVLNMDDEDGSPVLEGVRSTYGAPPREFESEHDEFSELGDRWDGSAENEEFGAPRRFVPGRTAWVALAASAGALGVVLLFGGKDVPPKGESSTEQVASTQPSAPRSKAAPERSVDGRVAASADDMLEGAERVAAEDEAIDASELATDGAPLDLAAGFERLLGAMTGEADPFGPLGAGATDGRDGRGTAQLPRERREGVISIGEQIVLPGPLSNVSIADASQMAGIWTGSELPEAGLANATFVQTPFIGDVRIHTSMTEFFDGELLGLGGGRIVLRMNSGALTLEAAQVRNVERLVEASHGPSGLVAKSTGERVRVRAAGGWIRGEVVREQGDSVTLMLDSGGRITVERRDVLPASTESTIRLDEAIAQR